MMVRRITLVTFAFLGIGLFPALRAAQQAGAASGARAAVPSHNSTALHRSSITTSEHFERFTKAAFNWQTAVVPAVTAGYSQLATNHKGFSDDWSGFGKHYGLNVVDDITFDFFGRFVMPAAFHQDDRYAPLGSASHFSGRMGHVVRHLFVARSADGRHDVLNMGAIPASLITAAVANAYEPEALRTGRATAQRFGFNLAAFVLEDTFLEFKGDLRRLWRH